MVIDRLIVPTLQRGNASTDETIERRKLHSHAGAWERSICLKYYHLMLLTDEEVETSFQDSDQSITREDIRHVLEAYRCKPTEEESELYAFLGKVVEKTLEEYEDNVKLKNSANSNHSENSDSDNR